MFYHPSMPMGGLNGLDRLATKSASEGCKPVADTPTERDTAVHKTLIPVHGSEGVVRAITHVDSLARAGLTSEVHLLSVQPPLTRRELISYHVARAEQTDQVATAQERMSTARTLFTSGVRVRVAVRFGRTARTIAQYANEQGISAIVVGTPARRSLRSMLRKAVAMELVRLVDIPVTLVRSVEDKHREVASNERVVSTHLAGAGGTQLFFERS